MERELTSAYIKRNALTNEHSPKSPHLGRFRGVINLRGFLPPPQPPPKEWELDSTLIHLFIALISPSLLERGLG
jgi:hypothetical protein